jgi:hypothetical protein
MREEVKGVLAGVGVAAGVYVVAFILYLMV